MCALGAGWALKLVVSAEIAAIIALSLLASVANRLLVVTSMSAPRGSRLIVMSHSRFSVGTGAVGLIAAPLVLGDLASEEPPVVAVVGTVDRGVATAVGVCVPGGIEVRRTTGPCRWATGDTRKRR